jgi:hypothetical protein
MEIVSNRKEKIFRKDFNGKPIYKIGLSKKDTNGKYVNGYILCSFKKGTDIPDKSYIMIKQSWLDFYIKDKETIPYIFINDYELVEEKKDTQVIEVQNITTEELDDNDFPLPF